jgi:hypothetical protein
VRRLQRLPIPERRAQQLVVLEEHIERARVVARLVAHLITMKRTTTLHRRWRVGGEPSKHASKQASKQTNKQTKRFIRHVNESEASVAAEPSAHAVECRG